MKHRLPGPERPSVAERRLAGTELLFGYRGGMPAAGHEEPLAAVCLPAAPIGRRAASQVALHDMIALDIYRSPCSM
jgi:hypothetical protein